MKCPCCKIINTLNEALKHKSVTSVQAASRAWEHYVSLKADELIPAILPCPNHGSEKGYSDFIDEANRKKDELVSRQEEELNRKLNLAVQEMCLRAGMHILFGGGGS